MTSIRILVVDDEVELREMLSDFLQQQSFEVVMAKDGEQMRQLVAEQSFDLLLLDKSMPGEDGFSLARYVREHYNMGIIMLTATNDLIDKVVGLEIGADDYMTKPFDLRELLARIKCVLRRNMLIQENVKKPQQVDSQKTIGRFVLDTAKCELRNSAGEKVQLTCMEFELLETFLAAPNRVLSREYLLDMGNKNGDDPFDRSIDTHISRIRKKIEQDPGKPRVIKTVRNIGYMYVSDSDE